MTPNDRSTFVSPSGYLTALGIGRLTEIFSDAYVHDPFQRVDIYDLRELCDEDPRGFSLWSSDGDKVNIASEEIFNALSSRLPGLQYDAATESIFARRRDALGIEFARCEPRPRVDYFDGMIEQSGVICVVAASGALKTWLCASLAADYAYGRPWLGRFDCHGQDAAGSARVVYVNADASRAAIRGRLAYCGNIDRVGVADYPNPQPDNPAFWDQLKRGVQPRLVIIDTLTSAVPGVSERDTIVALPIKLARRYANATGATVVFTHHEGHEAKRGLSVLRGSSAIGADLDMVLHMTAQKTSGPRERRSRVTAIKSKNFDRQPDPFTLRVCNGKVSIVDDQENEDEGERVYAMIEASGGMSRTALATELGLRKEHVLTQAKALIEAGRIREEGSGKNTRLVAIHDAGGTGGGAGIDTGSGSAPKIEEMRNH